MAMDENPNTNLQTVLSSTVESVKTAMRVKGCSLALLTPDRKYLRHMASCGLSESYITKGRISVEKAYLKLLKGISLLF
jgi:signal transduction protein with GAF and PtsI domain